MEIFKKSSSSIHDEGLSEEGSVAKCVDGDSERQSNKMKLMEELEKRWEVAKPVLSSLRV